MQLYIRRNLCCFPFVSAASSVHYCTRERNFYFSARENLRILLTVDRRGEEEEAEEEAASGKETGAGKLHISLLFLKTSFFSPRKLGFFTASRCYGGGRSFQGSLLLLLFLPKLQLFLLPTHQRYEMGRGKLAGLCFSPLLSSSSSWPYM